MSKREAALTEALSDARLQILRGDCHHSIVCADKKCREANHDHEGYGEDGWGCGEECPCIPACAGYEPETCPEATKARELVGRIDDLLAASSTPRGPAATPAERDEKGAGT